MEETLKNVSYEVNSGGGKIFRKLIMTNKRRVRPDSAQKY